MLQTTSAALPTGDLNAQTRCAAEAPEQKALDAVRVKLQEFAASDGETLLSLVGLGLTSLPDDALELLGASAARVERIDLAHNELRDLPYWLSRLPKLRVLFLLNNPLRRVPRVLVECDGLFMLSLRGCRLAGPLDVDALPRNLGWLILTDNAITELSPTFGARARGLRKLMLANNQLEALPDNMMDSGMDTTLELLRVANNRIARFPSCLRRAQRLAWLGLGGNPCACGVARDAYGIPPALRLRMKDFVVNQDDNGRLGRGTSGDVRSARRAHVRESSPEANPWPLAIKLFRSDATSDGAIIDECMATAALRSVPGLIPVHGFLMEDWSEPHIDSGGELAVTGVIMDRVHGMKPVASAPSFQTVSYDVYPADRRFSLQQVMSIATQVAKSAAAMHAKGWAHGDLYGHNVLYDDGRPGACYVVDLGAAYAIPEPICEKLDVRAFGILLEELVQRIPRAAIDLTESRIQYLHLLAGECMQPYPEKRPAFCRILKELSFARIGVSEK